MPYRARATHFPFIRLGPVPDHVNQIRRRRGLPKPKRPIIILIRITAPGSRRWSAQRLPNATDHHVLAYSLAQSLVVRHLPWRRRSSPACSAAAFWASYAVPCNNFVDTVDRLLGSGRASSVSLGGFLTAVTLSISTPGPGGWGDPAGSKCRAGVGQHQLGLPVGHRLVSAWIDWTTPRGHGNAFHAIERSICIRVDRPLQFHPGCRAVVGIDEYQHHESLQGAGVGHRASTAASRRQGAATHHPQGRTSTAAGGHDAYYRAELCFVGSLHDGTIWWRKSSSLLATTNAGSHPVPIHRRSSGTSEA